MLFCGSVLRSVSTTIKLCHGSEQNPPDVLIQGGKYSFYNVLYFNLLGINLGQ